jgi:7-keto-8-aminopelargonate synthetase-like enzyme
MNPTVAAVQSPLTASNSRRIAMTKSALNYIAQRGVALAERVAPFNEFVNSRRAMGTWWVGRVLASRPSHDAVVGDEFGANAKRCINFASQDYLSLTAHPRVLGAAKAGIEECGIHSAGSPAAIGRTNLLLELECKLSTIFQKEACTIFSTGWAAGFGVITGLVREDDAVIMDALAHNCIQEGANHATTHVSKFAHNDLDHLEKILRESRAHNARNGVFVILESLYSMDSDAPDLRRAIRLCRSYDAITILDVAHDFGAIGTRGLGLIEMVGQDEMPDLIFGSFSKTFASNGGFVVSSKDVKAYLSLNCPPLVFSNAISPLQTRIVHESLDIAFSPEGDALRSNLMKNVQSLRTQMSNKGFIVGGIPSAIVPVFVGEEQIARLTFSRLRDAGLLTMLVEFPAVAKGKARFRFQVMASHRTLDCAAAAETLFKARAEAIASGCIGSPTTDK